MKVLLADEHPVVLRGLESLFSDRKDLKNFEVVDSLVGGIQAFKAVKKFKPKLAILEPRMRNGNGLDCLSRIKLDFPDTIVLMFSMFDNPTYLARAMALGAAGYLLKSESEDVISATINEAASGEYIWSVEQTRMARGGLNSSANSDDDTTLTKREGEVLRQLAHGLTNKDIALALGISYETVKEHVQHILQKVGVSDRTQAAVWAVRRKLV